MKTTPFDLSVGRQSSLQPYKPSENRMGIFPNWVGKAEKQTLLSDILDLSELFHPDTFLNALRQETARVMSCSVDSLKFTASWKGQIREAKLQVQVLCAFRFLLIEMVF
uniref:Cytoplasmic dynein 2 heavy chain 1 n=1 Tax=Sphaerodactylus townsendi TaxID=933632 RepID=A0ACB8FH32_9SAUR